jgi:Sulfotransferase domain
MQIGDHCVMRGNGFAKEAGANSGEITPALPSFFVIGPPRTGTSWLHNVLSQCAWLSHPTKETRFFDKHFERGLDWYRSHYSRATEGRVIGEVAPTYFASPEARARIAGLIPQAKIVCTFRNPVDRVISLYRLKRAYGFLSWSFEEALARDPELTESSRYAGHLKAWRETFGESQVMATLHDDIQADPQSYFDKIADFLGIPRQRLRSSQLHRVFGSEDMTEPRHYYWTRGGLLMAEWAKKRRLDSFVATAKRYGALKLFVGGGAAFPDLPPSQRARLRERFRPEIEQLEAAINRDLSAWK